MQFGLRNVAAGAALAGRLADGAEVLAEAFAAEGAGTGGLGRGADARLGLEGAGGAGGLAEAGLAGGGLAGCFLGAWTSSHRKPAGQADRPGPCRSGSMKASSRGLGCLKGRSAERAVCRPWRSRAAEPEPRRAACSGRPPCAARVCVPDLLRPELLRGEPWRPACVMTRPSFVGRRRLSPDNTRQPGKMILPWWILVRRQLFLPTFFRRRKTLRCLQAPEGGVKAAAIPPPSRFPSFQEIRRRAVQDCSGFGIGSRVLDQPPLRQRPHDRVNVDSSNCRHPRP